MSDISGALVRWLERLKSPDAAAREKGIRALEALGDTRALPALATLFATDSDPALRALAQQAGKRIYYGALRRANEQREASEEERRRAAEVLAKAREKKRRNQP